MYDKIDASTLSLSEKMVSLDRVSKTVKGGRKMKFSALMVVGNGEGIVGVGIGKSTEVPDAINKGIEDAKKNLVRVTLKGTTIPHETVSEYGASLVILKPAAEGTGVIAGGAIRAVLELAGINDILSKCIGSRTPINMVRATVDALKNLKTIEEVAALRGKKPEEIRG